MIEVTPQSQILIEVVNNPIAIKGDKGEKGDNGTGINSLEFDFVSPQNTWIVNHNKGYYPTVLVFDIFNKVVLAEIEYSSQNQVKIYFNSAQSGKVIIN